MSELRTTLRVLALLAVGVAPVRAQAAAGAAPALERTRLDSLRAELETAKAAYAREDSLHRERVRAETRETLDTARVGPLLVVARTQELARVVAIVEPQWEALRPLMGEGSLHPATLLVGLRLPVDPREFAGRPAHHSVWLMPGIGLSPDARARRAIGGLLTAALPSALSTWLENASLGAVAAEDVLRELATSPAQAARQCRRGDLAACRAALAIAPAGPGWQNWYAPGELRRIVAARAIRPTPLSLACARGDAVACITYLEASGGPPPPLSTEARASFLESLLRARGTDAFATLATGSGDVAARLARLSGDGTLEAELAAWREHVIASHAPAGAGLPGAAALTLAWVAIFFGLAQRSTRWRHG